MDAVAHHASSQTLDDAMQREHLLNTYHLRMRCGLWMSVPRHGRCAQPLEIYPTLDEACASAVNKYA